MDRTLQVQSSEASFTSNGVASAVSPLPNSCLETSKSPENLNLLPKHSNIDTSLIQSPIDNLTAEGEVDHEPSPKDDSNATSEADSSQLIDR